jgi:hypothetical protein
MEIPVNEIRSGTQKVFSPEGDLFPEIASREHYQTPCFKEVVMLFPCDESYRKSAQKINRVLRRNQQDAIQYRTIDNMVEREGKDIQEHLEKKAEEILKKEGFTGGGKRISGYNEMTSDPSEESTGERKNPEMREIPSSEEFSGNKGDEPEIALFLIEEETIKKAIEEIHREKGVEIDLSELQGTFEDPMYVKANISIDDVLAKKQKESNREKDAPSKGKREFVKNTVAHLQNGEQEKYILHAVNLDKLLMLLLAFLLSNGLHPGGGQLLFFIDGDASLRQSIQSYFLGIWSFKIILDWFHLEKKCKERLSMAMKGKVIRNMVLSHITHLLWYGRVETAIAYLQDLNKDGIKNQEEIRLLIGYFERNRSYIPCYALRQKLGLRVSSNLGEKSNDLVVSSRQKHNGMSWSTSGSASLASVTTVHLNGEYPRWLLHHDIAFQFRKSEEKVAA